MCLVPAHFFSFPPLLLIPFIALRSQNGSSEVMSNVCIKQFLCTLFYSAWNQIRHWDDLIKTLHQSEVFTSVDSVFKYKQLQFTGGKKRNIEFSKLKSSQWVCLGGPGQQGIPQGQIINDRPLRRAQRTLEQKRVTEVDFMMLRLKVSWLWPWILMQNVTSCKSGLSITSFR